MPPKCVGDAKLSTLAQLTERCCQQAAAPGGGEGGGARGGKVRRAGRAATGTLVDVIAQVR